MGYYPPQVNYAYNEDYFHYYKDLEGTKICYELNRFRVDLVDTYIGDGELLDVGIGSGTFIKEREHKTYGCDINPMGIAWLKERDLYKGEDAEVENASYFDCLEHIPDIEEELDRVNNYVFVSIPIFEDEEDCLASKHLKPDEHLFYFTQEGFVDFFDFCGFECLHTCDTESQIGREGIMSFVFQRR